MYVEHVIFIAVCIVVLIIVPLLPEIVWLYFRRIKRERNLITIADVLLLLSGIIFGLAVYFIVAHLMRKGLP